MSTCIGNQTYKGIVTSLQRVNSPRLFPDTTRFALAKSDHIVVMLSSGQLGKKQNTVKRNTM